MLGDAPDDFVRDTEIFMPQDVAGGAYFIPWNFGLRRFHLGWNGLARFRNNLNGPLHGEAYCPVLFEPFETPPVRRPLNALDRLENLGDDRSDPARRRQNTRTALASMSARNMG